MNQIKHLPDHLQNKIFLYLQQPYLYDINLKKEVCEFKHWPDILKEVHIKHPMRGCLWNWWDWGLYDEDHCGNNSGIYPQSQLVKANVIQDHVNRVVGHTIFECDPFQYNHNYSPVFVMTQRLKNISNDYNNKIDLVKKNYGRFMSIYHRISDIFWESPSRNNLQDYFARNIIDVLHSIYILENELNNNTITPYLKPNGSIRPLTKEYIHLINSERSYFYNKINQKTPDWIKTSLNRKSIQIC